MALQNRVTPEGQIIATPARGGFMGNRGILHDAQQRLGPARWRHKAWICCLTRFRGRHRAVMAPNRYTELFFLDEAVALAAGHRPCAECRRADYSRFAAAWAQAMGLPAPPRAGQMDTCLHKARVRRDRSQITHEAALTDLPDGVFLRLPGQTGAWLWAEEQLHPYRPEGYGRPRPCPGGSAEVLTPAPSVAVLRAGYRPVMAITS